MLKNLEKRYIKAKHYYYYCYKFDSTHLRFLYKIIFIVFSIDFTNWYWHFQEKYTLTLEKILIL